jgi:hypothetical protein
MTMQNLALFSLPSTWHLAHPMDAADWRAAWMRAGIGDTHAWNRLRVVCARELLWVISGSPETNSWLDQHMNAIACAVTDVVGDAVAFEVRSRTIGVRASADRLWAYRFPRLVLAKGTGDWQPHFAHPLDPNILQRMQHVLESGIRRELTAWNRLPDVLDDQNHFLTITDPGRAVIIPAIHADRSGHGKSVNVLVRSNIIAISPIRIEGEVFAGPLASLGFGRMLRTSAPELLDTSTQRALLQLPDFQSLISPGDATP